MHRVIFLLLSLLWLLPGLTIRAGAAPPGYAYEHLEFMLDSAFAGAANPVHQMHVRQALALALDPTTVAAAGLRIPARQAARIVAWTPWVHVPGYTEPGLNTAITGRWDPIRHAYVQPGTPTALADARKLLAHSHFPKGFTLTLTTTENTPRRQREEAALAAAWKAIGITVVEDNGTPAKLFGDWDHGGVLVHGSFQVALFALDTPSDPQNFKYNLTSPYIDRLATVRTVTNGNYSGIRDPSMDASFAAAVAPTATWQDREAAYDVVQERLVREAYWVGLYFTPLP